MERYFYALKMVVVEYSEKVELTEVKRKVSERLVKLIREE